jgi:hypothetical protein
MDLLERIPHLFLGHGNLLLGKVHAQPRFLRRRLLLSSSIPLLPLSLSLTAWGLLLLLLLLLTRILPLHLLTRLAARETRRTLLRLGLGLLRLLRLLIWLLLLLLPHRSHLSGLLIVARVRLRWLQLRDLRSGRIRWWRLSRNLRGGHHTWRGHVNRIPLTAGSLTHHLPRLGGSLLTRHLRSLLDLLLRGRLLLGDG